MAKVVELTDDDIKIINHLVQYWLDTSYAAKLAPGTRQHAIELLRKVGYATTREY
jgi:hypothetical protein